MALEQTVNQQINCNTQGEVKNFSEFYDQYHRLVRSVLFKFCREQDLDDLVQDAFVKIYKALPRFKGESSLKTWIYKITYHLAIDDLKKRKRRGFDVEEQEVPVDSKENAMLEKDMVRRALDSLSEEHRSVIVLHCLEGLELKDVSEIIGKPIGTVKSRLFNAKAQMAERLKRLGVHL